MSFILGIFTLLVLLALIVVNPMVSIFAFIGGGAGYFVADITRASTGESWFLSILGFLLGIAIAAKLQENKEKEKQTSAKTKRQANTNKPNIFFTTKEETNMKTFILSRIDPKDEDINKCIDLQESFIVSGVDKSQAARVLEALIESKGMTCRVYTENRAAVMSAALIPTGITQLTGLATAVGMGVHNLLTLNPDYEIGKHPLENKVTVTYKKS